MRKIRHVYHCGDNCGEVEGMFDEDGTLIATWACNDAMWRGEYLNGFMLKLGIEIVSDDSPELHDQLEKHWYGR